MSGVPRVIAFPGQSWRGTLLVVGGLLGLAAALGCAIGQHPGVAMLVCALAAVVLAIPFVDSLSVLTFAFLPYLILNIPSGSGMTLKVPEVTAYLFAAAALARALLRREPISLPPATPQVLLYLGVVAVSAAFAPPVPTGMETQRMTGLQGADLRPASVLFWLTLSWLVVVSLYHVVGTSRVLYRRCVRAHILTGAVASLIGIIGYALTLRGSDLALRAIGNGHSFVFNGGSFYRLTGVSYEPLLFAFYLVTVMPVTLTVAIYRTDWMPRWVSLTALFLQGLALLLTFSAGGWAALAIGLFLMAYLFRPKRFEWRQVAPYVVSTAGLLGLVAVFCWLNPVISRTMNNAIGKLMSGGYKMRDDENLTGLRIFEHHFWLGAGPGMTPFHFLWYHPVAYTEDQAVSIYVNNLYIAALAETGIVGLTALLVCGIVGACLLGRVIVLCGPKRVPVLTALVISLLGCAIQYWETQNLFLIYFTALVGLAAAGARLGLSGEQPSTAVTRRLR